MSDQRLKELLSTLPENDELESRAARARHRALARLDEPAPIIVRKYVWGPAMVVAALALLVIGVFFRAPAPAPQTLVAASSQPKKHPQERLRMKWVLSDGTRVLWTFKRDLNL
jgi:hypothetical protein